MLTLAFLLAVAPAPQAEAWRIVPGSRPDPLPVPAAQLRAAYFRDRDVTVVTLAELDAEPATSRLVVGLPAADPAIAALAARFGAVLVEGALHFQGRAVAAGSGLRLGAADPDGGGTLVLVVASDEAGLRAPFTVRMDLLAAGFTIATAGRIVEEGALPPFRADELAPERPLAVRLDLDCGRLLDQTADWPLGERARRLAHAFAGYTDVLERAAGAPIAAEDFFARLLRAPDAPLAQARARFASLPLQERVEEIWCRSLTTLGPVAQPAPAVHFLLAPATWTNATTFAPAAPGGRPRILVNLTACADELALMTALAHECAHLHQSPPPEGLLGRCALEGVATFLSQEIAPGTPDAAALMWSAAELQAVEERAPEVLARFREDALGSERPRLAQWLQLDRTHAALPGLPSRLGYWVGWRAARAWRAAHPDAPVAELLRLPAEALLLPILP
jgi:hypothetical protein